MEAFNLIADLGFSIAAVIGGGFFIILLLKYILDSVVGRAVSLNAMIGALDNRVKTINNEIVRLDTLICHALGVKPDTRRLSAADGKEDTKERINRVLTNDPGIGVARHVDAGYDKAIEPAKKRNLDVPSIND